MCNRQACWKPCSRRSPAVTVTLRPLLAAALLFVQLPAAADAAAGSQIGLWANCTTSCGGVSVPYPFGIEPGCYLQGFGFDLTCNTSYKKPPQLFIFTEMKPDLQVTNISVYDATIEIIQGKRIASARTRQLPTNLGSGLGLNLSLKQVLNMGWYVASNALLQPSQNKTRAGNETCPRDLGSISCHSSYSTCEAAIDPNNNYRGYICKCDNGFKGNPYLVHGCQDIDECILPNKCFGECTNLPGTYLCQCPKGVNGDPFIPNGCSHPYPGIIIGLGVGSGALVIVLSLGTMIAIHKIRTRRKKMIRQRFFKQNRGQLLQQLVSHKADIAERMIVTLEELEKATNNFDRARKLGGGGHGTVYKGILSSLHVVAIKKSKIVIQKEIDDFINEVAILYQINHRNIVKLLCCCLETEVPLLVYEFISNGTLYNHLHVEVSVSLSWKQRLRIAVEIAKALAYLHSSASVPIVHRDVKSSNILLDNNLTVKLSDFGASRYVPLDQSGVDTTVQGTFGYLDPIYHSTGHLTEKSDVYSFGVILIELLTRKKPVLYRSSQGHSLVYHFVNLLSEHNLVRILDPQVARVGGGEVIDVALLATVCVKLASSERPAMRHVEMVLESIHAAVEEVSSNMTDDESDENFVQVNSPYIIGRPYLGAGVLQAESG
ncbi:hypothetical protein ACP4OV_014851 [Aristida adscensionis]